MLQRCCIQEWMDYGPAAERLQLAAVHARGYTGQGTALVHFEGRSLRWAAVQAQTGEPLFGDCSRPEGAIDHLGWQPAGANCRIAWVMCVTAAGRAGRRSCEVETGAHPTQTAKGLIEVAPDASIIALQLRNLPASPKPLQFRE